MNRRAFSQWIVGTALGQAFPGAHAQTALGNAAGENHSPSAEFRFSIMLWTIDHKLPIDHCLEIAAAGGYNGVEFTGEYRKWTPDETRRIKAKMRSLGLVVDSISGKQAGFADPNATSQLLADFNALLGYAKELECPQIILLSGKRIDGLPQGAQHSACIENLKRVADLAARNNVEVVIEPIDRIENPTIYLTTVSEGFDIVRAVGSPHLKVLYDFYHEQRGYGNLIEKLENNIDSIGLVHIADVPGRHEPGTGEIDYLNIYRKLAQLKYNKFAAMEYMPTYDPQESLKTARLAALRATRTTPAPYSASM